MKKSIFIFLLSVLFCSSVLGQDAVAISRLQSYVQKIQVFNRLVPQEKVYLHFDNTSYALGETIWFKAYLLRADDYQLESPSKVLYVELLNSKGEVLETKKIKIEKGSGYGEFVLDPLNVEYFPGWYEIRAYTRNMLNFGDETVFSRVFPVFNEIRQNGDYVEEDLKGNSDVSLVDHREKSPKQKKVSISFYPEGGNLVNGILSRVAFKVTGEDGLPLSGVEGAMINDQGETLSKFSVMHQGMGIFLYLPTNEKRKVRLTYQNQKYEFNLPDYQQKGYVMNVNNFSKDVVGIGIEKTPELAPATLGVSVMCRGKISYFESILMDSLSCLFSIPKRLLSSGVNQLTLFDQKGEIYAERLFFIHPKEEELIAVKVKTDKELYEPLEEIKVTLQIASKTISSDYNFSLSVRDRNNGVEVSSVDNIATYLLLSSDLRGFIEDPSFYFQDESYSRVMSLDLLLMVQGWRRYDWLSMSGIKPFEKRYSTEYQLIIEGHVASSSKIDMEVKARMDNGDTLYMETSTWTDENKRFCFLPEDFYGTWNIALRCGQVKEANKDIRLDRWFSPRPKTYSPLEKIWRKKVSLRDGESLLSRRLGEEKGNISILLSEVNVSARRGKDRTFHVNREVDKLIDQGKKVPVSVHDYLSDVDYNYSYESASYFLEPGAGNYLHYNEDKMSFVEKIGRESVVSRNDFVDRWDIQNPKKLNSDNAIVDHTNTNSSNIILRKLNYDDPENYRTDPFTVENGIYFYKKPTQAVFFYLENDQWKTKSSERLRTSKSTYGVSNHELTSKRILKEVDKIVIFGSHKRDIYGSPFTPIYIYPLKNFMLRVLPGTRYTTFDGYSKPKEFYVNQINSDLAKPAINYEYHRTLYWNPDMEINEDGSASVSFYNNAVTRNIEVSAEGITNDGFFMSNELKGE